MTTPGDPSRPAGDPNVPTVRESNSEPGVTAVSMVGDREVNYWFPVEIEIVGARSASAALAGSDLAETLAQSIYQALQRELSALG